MWTDHKKINKIGHIYCHFTCTLLLCRDTNNYFGGVVKYIIFSWQFMRFMCLSLANILIPIYIWTSDWTGHPNMGGAMQRMTPPRGMVPLGPQVRSSHLCVWITHLNCAKALCYISFFIVPGIWRGHETTTQCSWGSWDAWDEYVRTSSYTNTYLPNNKYYFLP